MKIGAGALIVHDRAALLGVRSAQEHEPFTLSVFGGMMEDGETPYGCMLREVLQESGLNLHGVPVQLIDKFHNPEDDFEFYTYLVRLEGARPNVILSEESVAYHWVELGRTEETLWEHVIKHELHSGMAAFVSKAEVRETVIRHLI